jgi:hypothetical protein
VQSTPRGLTNAAASLQADDSHHGDRFGRTVVLHGNHLIVGERVKLVTGIQCVCAPKSPEKQKQHAEQIYHGLSTTLS